MSISFARNERPISRPPFIVDETSIVRDTGRQIAWELLDERYQYGAWQVVADGTNSQSATTFNCEALEYELPAFTVLRFGADEFVRTTEVGNVGDTSIACEALVNAIEDGDVSYVDTDFIPGGVIPAGTCMDLLSDGRVAPSALAISTGSPTAYGLLETPAEEANRNDAASGYGIICAGFIYDNLLPEASGSPAALSGTWKTELLARGGAWMFTQYSDNTD